MNDVELQSLPEGGAIVYRLVCNGVASPTLRSSDAAKVYLQDGHFAQYCQGLAAVTSQAAHAAKMVNAQSDKQLTVALLPKVIPFAQ